MWYHATSARALPDRRYLVADRDRHDHDLAAARPHQHEAGSATQPFPGVFAEIRDSQGSASRPAAAFSRSRAVAGDAARHLRRSERFVKTYLSRWDDGVYFTGDGARRDDDGFFWLLGRVDDVLNVAGHRLGTMEVESALVDHPMVAEAAVVGRPHEIKGQAAWRSSP
jgi:acetyl-CoA synthetase